MVYVCYILYFNSHAHVERDLITIVKNQVLVISTHTLTWSVTCMRNRFTKISTFQLTRSRGAWLIQFSEFLGYKKFQLTRSRGAWQKAWHTIRTDKNFNSHAHVERDMKKMGFFHQPCISTHTLTWSVTSDNGIEMTDMTISTHTLTWSVTDTIIYICDFGKISTHTLTWSVTKSKSQV